MATYQYRRGNGNDGSFFRFLVDLDAKDCPHAALRALVPSDYTSGRAARRHIIRSIEVDGDAEYGLHASVHEGPKGEVAGNGEAWLTAELIPLSAEDAEWEVDQNRTRCGTLRELLDAPAWRLYRAELRGKGKV